MSSRRISAVAGGALCVVWLAVTAASVPRATTAADPPDQGQAAKNPYTARSGLSTAQLARYLERMSERPKSIRGRSGFAEAVVDAADRILAAEASGEQQTIAVLAKFQALHFMAVRGAAAADEQVLKLAEQYKDDGREAISHEAKFHLLERRVLSAERLKPDELPALLDEVKEYLTAQPALDNRHLRLASATVKIINALEDGEQADKAYKQFGELFAASDDREMAKYGKKISRGATPTKLVGKSMEIEGIALDGTVLDWSAYRGKIVLVDFWATWCGPCLAELPGVKQAYEQFHDKGFDIVGISLDTDRDKLEQFIADESIPWVNLFGEDEAIGWKHAMATRHGVRAIPATFLVDRKGKVIAENLRGEKLARRLEVIFAAGGDDIPAAEDDAGDQPADENDE